MINAKKKGSRLELKTRDWLIKGGYLVTKSGGSLGMFDLIAMLESSLYHKKQPHWRLVQVKANRCLKKERLQIKSLVVPPYTQKEIWIWKDYAREPEVEIYS